MRRRMHVSYGPEVDSDLAFSSSFFFISMASLTRVQYEYVSGCVVSLQEEPQGVRQPPKLRQRLKQLLLHRTLRRFCWSSTCEALVRRSINGWMGGLQKLFGRLKKLSEEYLSKYKQSSAAEKKALYDEIK